MLTNFFASTKVPTKMASSPLLLATATSGAAAPAVGHQSSGLEGVGQWQDGVEQGVLQSRGQSQE